MKSNAPKAEPEAVIYLTDNGGHIEHGDAVGIVKVERVVPGCRWFNEINRLEREFPEYKNRLRACNAEEWDRYWNEEKQITLF